LSQELIVPFRIATIELMVTNDERQAFSDRLNQVLDDQGYPPKGSGRQNRLAKDWGLSQKGVRKWLEGEGVPETTRLIEMAKRYQVSFEWLATGRSNRELSHRSTGTGDAGGRLLFIDSGVTPKLRMKLRPYASSLVEAIEKADADGMPDEAFTAMAQTLRAFEKLWRPGDRQDEPRLLDIHHPDPEGA